MIVISWNCRGALGNDFGRAFREMVHTYKPDLVALQEPRCTGRRAANRIRNFGFRFSAVVDGEGFSGGIWLLWNRDDISVLVLEENRHYLHVRIAEDGLDDWFLTIIYASPREAERQDTWNALNNIASRMEGRWLMVGDFNETASIEETK